MNDCEPENVFKGILFDSGCNKCYIISLQQLKAFATGKQYHVFPIVKNSNGRNISGVGSICRTLGTVNGLRVITLTIPFPQFNC